MNVVWINELASGGGGAERYVSDTAAALAAHRVRSTLLYEVTSRVSPSMTAPFEATLPLVDVERQLARIAPDLVYVHQLSDERILDRILDAGVPVVRFFHDHRLLCLREHKYTPIAKTPCTKTIGLDCYSCLGFVRHRRGAGGMELVSLGRARKDLARHRRVARVIVASEYMKRHAVASGIPEAQVEVVPLGTLAPVTERAPAPPREPGLVLFVGALTTGKGIDVLLRALPRVRTSARLVLAGDGPQREALESLARTLGLGDRATFAGRQSPDALDALYRRASVLACPSRQPESFGLVGLEAMSRGLPVVASGHGGTGEWLVHERNGLMVDPNDVDALTRALDRVLGDGAFAAELGTRGLHMHSTSFQRHHHTTRLMEIFDDVQRRAA